MSDRPWLENGDPSLRPERELLKRLNAQQPPPGSIDHGWAALAAEIPALHAPPQAANAPVPTHGIPHAVGGGSMALTAKVVASFAIAGAALWGGATLFKTESAPRSPVVSVAPKPLPSPTEVAPALPSSNDAQSPTAADAEQPALLPRAPTNSSTTLVEEGRLLAKAHQLVQSGQGRQALDVLHLSASRYPHSALYQEREVLTIEALDATGATAAAKQRAQRFLKRYPNSPHAGSLQRFAE